MPQLRMSVFRLKPSSGVPSQSLSTVSQVSVSGITWPWQTPQVPV